MAISVIYETHATSLDNEAGIATGWLPGQLSERGKHEAMQLGQRRRHENLAAIFSSDLWRAVETIELAFVGLDVQHFQDARLRECNYGVLNGAPVVQLAPLRGRHVDVPFPGGQSYRDVVEQTRSFLLDVSQVWNGQSVLLVAHSANRWALEHLFHGTPLEELVNAPFAWQEGWEYTLDPDTLNAIQTDSPFITAKL
jgi:broad specificity phosphatase PhoE